MLSFEWMKENVKQGPSRARNEMPLCGRGKSRSEEVIEVGEAKTEESVL